MPKKQWDEKEKKDAKLFGARRTPRSGGIWFAKGDSKSDQFLIENKTTVNERFSITAQVWEKISKEALLTSRVPLLSVEFGKKKHEIVVMDKNDFDVLLQALKKE